MYLTAKDDRTMEQIKADMNKFRNSLSQNVIEFKKQNTNRVVLQKEQLKLEVKRQKILQAEQKQKKLILQKRNPFSTTVSKERFFIDPNTMLHKHQPYLKEKMLIDAASTDKFSNTKHDWKYVPFKMDYMTNLFGHRLSQPNESTKKSPVNRVLPLTHIGEELVKKSEEQYVDLVNLDAENNRNKYNGSYKKECVSQKNLIEPPVWNKNNYQGGSFLKYGYDSQKFLDWRQKDQVVSVDKKVERKVWNPVTNFPTYFTNKPTK